MPSELFSLEEDEEGKLKVEWVLCPVYDDADDYLRRTRGVFAYLLRHNESYNPTGMLALRFLVFWSAVCEICRRSYGKAYTLLADLANGADKPRYWIGWHPEDYV